MTNDTEFAKTRTVDRRELLAALGTVGAGASLSGCSFLNRGADADAEELSESEARDLAERFAPTLYFDEKEKWFPTDPRTYVTEEDGETVVDGFAALDGYTERTNESETPPDPTVFFNGVKYPESPLAVVQFWYYSAFDQFTTNFHWHDWEVLHVFVDTDTDEPQLFVASSHSGNVPNNEFLDPDSEQSPRILSELGSHSSALSLNEDADGFQRLPFDGSLADITNSAIEGVETLSEIPVAYGLPRDEGTRLPYLVPELDGSPLFHHDRLPAVDRSTLITDELTVSSFTDLASPPGDLPQRETGLVFRHKEASEEADVAYDLVPSKVLEVIEDFTGPQLSFEFYVPEFGEDALSGHITTTGVPWDQPRYSAPAEDISDPTHRAALAQRYEDIGEPAPVHMIVADVTEAVSNDDAPENEGLTTEDSTVETVALMESSPEGVPTFGGVAILQDVPPGDHRLTINGAGVQPHSESVTVADDDSGPTTAGVEGEIPLVARERSVKLEVDADGTDAELDRLAIEDDFADRLYDAPIDGPDAVYVHRGGAYTTEVRDTNDELGAFRVNPAEEASVRIEEPHTGKASLAGYVADVATESAEAVSAVASDDDDDGPSDENENRPTTGGTSQVTGLARALEAVAEAAQRAVERAQAGNRGEADRSLTTVQDRLERVSQRLTDAGPDLPAETERALQHRSDQLDKRSSQARDASKL